MYSRQINMSVLMTHLVLTWAATGTMTLTASLLMTQREKAVQDTVLATWAVLTCHHLLLTLKDTNTGDSTDALVAQRCKVTCSTWLVLFTASMRGQPCQETALNQEKCSGPLSKMLSDSTRFNGTVTIRTPKKMVKDLPHVVSDSTSLRLTMSARATHTVSQVTPVTDFPSSTSTGTLSIAPSMSSVGKTSHGVNLEKLI